MVNKTNPEYETAQSRIKGLIEEIGEQLNAISSPTDPTEPNDVGSVIAVQDKSGFICKQAELIAAFISRDNNDPRDAYIAELEEKLAELEGKLAKADRYAKSESDRWFKEFQTNKHLKSALNSLTAVLTQD